MTPIVPLAERAARVAIDQLVLRAPGIQSMVLCNSPAHAQQDTMIKVGRETESSNPTSDRMTKHRPRYRLTLIYGHGPRNRPAMSGCKLTPVAVLSAPNSGKQKSRRLYHRCRGDSARADGSSIEVGSSSTTSSARSTT